TLFYIVVANFIRSRKINLAVQIAGDLIVETLLVYFTGGLDSPFSFLYLVSIITASMLLFRRGGLFTASGAVMLYGGLADLMYYRVIAMPESSWIVPTLWTSSRLYINMATNFAGYYATALLTSYLSEKLQKTFEELDVNRQNLAALQALNQNVVESIPSGLITLSREGVVSFINPAGCQILRTNPQAVIAGSVQVLKKSNALSPPEQRLMTIILKESERLNKSIADFLRFVKPQEKRTAEFDIAASLSETLDLLANSPELRPDHHIE